MARMPAEAETDLVRLREAVTEADRIRAERPRRRSGYARRPPSGSARCRSAVYAFRSGRIRMTQALIRTAFGPAPRLDLYWAL
ncbi:hypothetical protein GCM10010345_04310 [Streptomyces canarius]|uniref:Uncharacterized protein n=1 Tax=Streptomyces canarius TaxID=285453 RepID=A0ABQ3CF10_9ACTN|nr:hypothetical protein GCM10010345_04310 [Streptomyces canarius]